MQHISFLLYLHFNKVIWSVQLCLTSYEELSYGRFAYVDQIGKKFSVFLLRVLLAIIVTLNLKPGKP